MTITAGDENGKCSLSLRCMGPNSESWFQDLVDFLMPHDAAGDATMDWYPLPELPSLGTTSSPPSLPLPPAPPAPVRALASVDEALPYVPKKAGVRREWKAVWNRIKPLADQGKSCVYIEGWLLQHDNDHQQTKKTIVKIIRAGEAGLLD